MKLKSITVKNFKKVEDATINLNHNLKILVGSNNSGKSSFIQGMLLGYQSLLKLFERGRIVFTEDNLIDMELTLKKKGIRIEDFQFLLDDLKSLFNVKVSKISEKNEIVTLHFEEEKYITISASLIGEYFSVAVADCSKNLTKHDIESFLEKPITLIPSFFTVVINEERKSIARYNSLLKNGNYNQLFRNILFDLKMNKPNSFKELVELVDNIFGIKGLDVIFDEQKDEFIRAEYAINGIERRNTKRLEVSTLGMGTLQFIQVLAQVLTGQPSVILLDEPDAHLHSDLQVKVINLLNDLSSQHNIKFIIATHSKDMINSINPSQVVSFNDAGELVEIKENNEFINVLKTLGASTEELIGVNIGKRLVVVEGEDDITNLKELCKLFNVDELENFNLVKFVSLGGRENVLKNQLFDFFTTAINLNDFNKLAVVDRDYRFLDNHLADAEKLKSKGFDVIPWSKKELENYFINPYVIARVINENYPQKNEITAEQVQGIIDNTYEDFKEDTMINEYGKALELKERERIKEKTGTIVKELGDTSKIECRKTAREYLDNQEKADIVPGKEVIKNVRLNLINSNTPSQKDFIKKIIVNLETDEVHEDLIQFINMVKSYAE